MTMPTSARSRLAHFTRLRGRFAGRDRQATLIHEIRNGNIRQLFPAELDWGLTFDGAATANFIDVVARDMAEGIAPLPALRCVSGSMKTDADLRRATVKNLIGESYWIHSRLENQMLSGADQYVSYSFLPFFIEPDTKAKKPRITLINPRHSYYELDRWGCTTVFAHVFLKSVDVLAALYPEYETVIRQDPKMPQQEVGGDQLLEMVMWIDDTDVTFFLPERDGLVLGGYAHKMSRVPVQIAERPGEDEHPRGQFDDVMWVQVARAVTAGLLLEAQAKAVQAPVAVPDDMNEFPVGPDAILQSKDANQIHRVNLEVPQGIFAESQVLDQELRVGSRYPEARSGDPGTSVITGKGVEALLGAFDSQIKGAQIVMKYALECVTSMCFEMDEVWWPDDSKTIMGTTSGTTYEFSYIPSRDINGRWNCTVTYGFAAGLQPEQSSILMLQLAGAGMISKSTVQENLAFSIDEVQEGRKIHIEHLRDGVEQGLLALLAASGQMVAQGQDALPAIKLGVSVIRSIQNGESIEDAIEAAFETMQQEQQAQAEAAQQAQAAAGGSPDQGGAADQQDQQAQIGQAGLPAGGRPSLNQLISGFRGQGNTPVLQADIKRQLPVVGG